MSPIKKVMIQFSHFAGGNAFVLFIGCISFPILTRIMSKEEYAFLGLVTVTLSIAVAIAKCGLSEGIIRFHESYSEEVDQRTVFSSTVFIMSVFFTMVSVLLYFLGIPLLLEIVHIKKDFEICFKIMAIYMFSRSINIVVLNFLRVNNKTIFFNILQAFSKVLSTVLSICLFLYVFKELYGFFIGIISTELVLSVVLISWFLKNYAIVFKTISMDLSIVMMKFGLPLLASELMYLLLSYVDRYMILAYNGAEELAMYSVGYNLSMYIAGVIIFPLTYSVRPMFVNIYENSGRKETERFLNKSLHYFLLAIIPICFGYYAVSPDLFLLLASEKYVMAAQFSPIILVATLLLGMNNIINAGLYLEKKTMIILFTMVCTVVVNIILNLILLPEYGPFGAAVSTFISCLVVVLASLVLSFKFIRLRVNFFDIFFYVMIGFFMCFIVMKINLAPIWIGLLVKVSVGALIFLVVAVLKEKELAERVVKFYRKAVS